VDILAHKEFAGQLQNGIHFGSMHDSLPLLGGPMAACKISRYFTVQPL
jgi:hypothetical protein